MIDRMIKMIFFCRRRDTVTHDDYARMVLDDHVPLALRHHATMQRYTVNIVDRSPDGEREYDSIGELSFHTLADYEERLYDSAAGEKIIHADVARFMGSAEAYITTEHINKELDTPAPLGTRHEAVKMICPILRRDGMSHDEFVEHWLHRHKPLALRHHPGLIRYVANVVDGKLTEEAPDLDGIAELTFASMRSVKEEMFDSPDGEKVINDDIQKFIANTYAYVCSEYVQLR